VPRSRSTRSEEFQRASNAILRLVEDHDVRRRDGRLTGSRSREPSSALQTSSRLPACCIQTAATASDTTHGGLPATARTRSFRQCLCTGEDEHGDRDRNRDQDRASTRVIDIETHTENAIGTVHPNRGRRERLSCRFRTCGCACTSSAQSLASLGLSPVALRTLWGTHPGHTRASLLPPGNPLPSLPTQSGSHLIQCWQHPSSRPTISMNGIDDAPVAAGRTRRSRGRPADSGG
jgi:hypothetical protein